MLSNILPYFQSHHRGAGEGICPSEEVSSTGLLGGLQHTWLLETGAYTMQFGAVIHRPFDLHASTSQLSQQLKS